MRKLALLLLSLLALGALGLAACESDDDETTAASATEITDTRTTGGDDEDGTTEATDSPEVSPEGTTEATVSPETTLPAKLSPELVRALRRDANTWASRWALIGCNRYMGQPICVRLDCARHGVPIENCTPASAAFRQSLADAAVEDIKYKGIEQIGGPVGSIYLAAVTYSNGVVVVFGGGRPEVELPEGSCAGSGGDCTWNLADRNRRFIQAATTPP
jgi:hypothetical protein